jgi:hypothetical protein
MNCQRVRSELSQMWKYMLLCKQPDKPKISLSNYLVDERALNSYSLLDLCSLQQLFKTLSESHNIFMNHIINECEVSFQCIQFFDFLFNYLWFNILNIRKTYQNFLFVFNRKFIVYIFEIILIDLKYKYLLRDVVEKDSSVNYVVIKRIFFSRFPQI